MNQIVHKIGPLYFVKGSTAYEFQLGKYCLRVVHLRGGFWNYRNCLKRFQYSKEVPRGKTS